MAHDMTDAPDLVRRLDDSESLARQWELNAEEFADRDMPRMADAAIQMASHIRAQAAEIAALRGELEKVRKDTLEQSADVCRQAAIALISNGHARVNQIDRHVASVLQDKAKRIAALRPLPPAPDAEGG